MYYESELDGGSRGQRREMIVESTSVKEQILNGFKWFKEKKYSKVSGLEAKSQV